MPAWVWVVIAALVIVVVPVLGCGACGLGAALAAQQPSTSVALTPSVGLIRIEGPIIPGESGGLGGRVAASDTIVGLIERASSDANIKALVLRIDSPGGGVVASDEIHHALTQLDKPIVVSMGSVAASGGYLISAAADYVYTTPYTLTGSIGVISQFVTVEDLLDKFGVEVVVITAGDAKDFGSFHRDMTEEERAYWDSLLEETHEGFIQAVADGRNMPVEDVRAVADGRIVLGEQAVELGLADETGYLDNAIAKAGELSGLGDRPNVVEIEPEAGLLEALYGFQASQTLPPGFDLLLRALTPPSLEYRFVWP